MQPSQKGLLSKDGVWTIAGLMLGCVGRVFSLLSFALVLLVTSWAVLQRHHRHRPFGFSSGLDFSLFIIVAPCKAIQDHRARLRVQPIPFCMWA
eukprot:10241323-Karenia_brevis.AAC.1